MVVKGISVAARKQKVDFTTFKAEWDKHGKGAGHIHNQQMIDEGKPDIVLAFPGNRGTADMIKRSKKAGLPVTVVGP